MWNAISVCLASGGCYSYAVVMPHKTIEARREYHRKWRALHPDYTAAAARKHRAANPESSRRDYLKHKASYIARAKKWQLLNPEKTYQQKRKAGLKFRTDKREHFLQTQKNWRLKNREHYLRNSKAWKRRNADKMRLQRKRIVLSGKATEHKHRRRAREKSALSTDCKQAIRLLRLMPLCQYCFTSIKGTPSIDHKIPISRGGPHIPSNLVAACLPCNSSKCDKLPSEWSGRILEEAA